MFCLLAVSVFFVVRHLGGAGSPASGKTGVQGKRLPGKKKPVLCFVIDDVGQSRTQLEPFLNFPGPLTLAVLPFLAQSRQDAEEAVRRGKTVILHEPMQALGNQDPGPEALWMSDTEEQIRAKLSQALDSLPWVVGVNNHMGSAFTEDAGKMKIVLQVVKERRLFFLDSKTTSRSTAGAVSMSLGMSIQERDVFLDNEKSREYILQAIEEGKKTSLAKGRAVMIGHVWSSDLAQILMEIYPTLLEEGFTLEDLSRFMQGDVSDDGLGD